MNTQPESITRSFTVRMSENERQFNVNMGENKQLFNVNMGDAKTVTSLGVRIVDVNLYAEKWEGDKNLYRQVVYVPTVTTKTQVDLTPSAEQLVIFREKDLALVTENDDGVVTVYAIGQKPTNDYTIQATLTEVKV